MSLPRRSFLALTAAVGVTAACSNPTTPPPSTSPTPVPSASRAVGSPTPSSATPSETPSEPSATPTKLGEPKATELVTGLTSPWGLVPLRDGGFLVSERDTRRIKRIVGRQVAVVATVQDAEPNAEGGLLGLAATADARSVFAYFTSGRDNRIARFSWDGNRLGQPEVILDGIPYGARHNGGRMIVGPDNLLYVSTGETGDRELAQDRDSLAGKILRITTDGDPAPGNPFDNEVFSYGHRNVQGLVFDPEGRLWASEFGDSTWDELNLIKAGGNYGWPQVEGRGGGSDLIDPLAVWSPSDASPSGLTYWKGSLYLAALRGERLWEVPLDGDEVGEPIAHFTETYGRLRSVEVAADGESLLVLTNNTDGRTQPRDGDDRLLRITR
ncbi:PQQ-dependent sugar dehydrogenase [Microlunatus speluncae]|uniref:PQQ-dependent sugar dehydrogenase n=1 Tax=Microlunatus speluncae TaxID=2594267 RepID=UPI0012660C93|nr:PQQ-dependent sugar dehydrogenase [Microlunatus speluncae]